MNRKILFALVLFILISLPSLSSLSTQSDDGNVVVISIDGARADFLFRLMEEGMLPNLQNLASRGSMAAFSVSVLPSLTAVAHASISTGAWPGTTGIVSNYFHVVTDPIYKGTDGFGAPLKAEAIWITAIENGKSVATIGWPCTDADDPERRGDWTVSWGTRDAYSYSKDIKSWWWKDANWVMGDVISYSTPKEAYFYLKVGWKKYYVNILAIDTTDDLEENYDAVYFDDDKDLTNGYYGGPLRLGDWCPIELPNPERSGSWVKIMVFKPDLSAFNLFLGAVWHTNAYPEELEEYINDEFGFFPGDPDYYALEHGYIDEITYLEQAERLADWLADITIYLIEEYDPDLVLAYQPQVDECEHQFLLVDPRQLGYTPERSEEYIGYLEWAYELADENVGGIVGAAGYDSTFFVISDHGMAPIHTVVYINEILKEAGLLVTYTKGSWTYIDTSATKAYAFTSGAAAHIYINLEGREPTGIVPPEEYREVQRQIVELLQSVRDPETGEEVFDIITIKEMTKAFHLYNENTGDVFVTTRKGYTLSYQYWVGIQFEPSTYYGQHGYNPLIPELYATFIACGPRIRHTIIAPIRIIDIAPTVCYALNIPPPADAEGRVLHQIFVHHP